MLDSADTIPVSQDDSISSVIKVVKATDIVLKPDFVIGFASQAIVLNSASVSNFDTCNFSRPTILADVVLSETDISVSNGVASCLTPDQTNFKAKPHEMKLQLGLKDSEQKISLSITIKTVKPLVISHAEVMKNLKVVLWMAVENYRQHTGLLHPDNIIYAKQVKFTCLWTAESITQTEAQIRIIKAMPAIECPVSD